MTPAMIYLLSSSVARYAAFIVVCMAAPLSSSECPTLTPPSCPCVTTELGYVLQCPTFTVIVISYGDVYIHCSTNDVSDFPELNGMRIGEMWKFRMRQCQLPSVPLSRLMQNMGVSGVNHLYLHNIAHLSDDIFTDLPSVTEIILEYDNVVLPKSIFRGLPQLNMLKLRSNSLTYLEAGIFHNLMQLRWLSLSGDFRNLSTAVLSDLHSLGHLVITMNKMAELPQDIFVDLINLKGIVLQQNEFLSLPQDLFIKNPRLKIVHLKNNKRTLEKLPPRLLADLTALDKVTLISCNISSLPDDLLWGSIQIRVISLHNNALTTSPEQLFRDCRVLEELDLSFNRITDLPPLIFNNTGKLKTLDLSNNRLTNITYSLFSNLRRLKVLNLEKNVLKHIEMAAFYALRNLRSLNMANNMLTSEYNSTHSMSFLWPAFKLEDIQLANNSITKIFPDWRLRLHLETLNLSYNKISRLEAVDLHFETLNTIKVDISYNNISDLEILDSKALVGDSVYRYTLKDKQYIESMYGYSEPKLRYFYIGGNPNDCGCERYSLVELEKNGIKVEVEIIIKLDYKQFDVCDDQNYKDIPLKHFDCLFKQEYRSVCRKQCSCVFRRSDKALLVDCYLRNLTSMPEALPDLWFSSHTELNLSGNRIKSVKSPLGPGYSKVTKYNLSANVISDIDLTAFSPKLQVLAIDRNNIAQFNKSSIEFLKNATHLTELTLHGNPWTCDCKTENFVTLIKSFYISKKVKLHSNTTCENGKLIYNMSDEELCPGEPEIKTVVDVASTVGIVFAVSITVGFIVGLVALYYKFQKEIKVWLYAHHICLRFVTEDELDRDKVYDAFISYSHQNEDFVADHLVPGLENGPVGYKLCVHYRNWLAGEYIPTQIAKSVEESRRTIVVLSPAFLQSVWGRMEFQAAHRQALSEGRVRVIIILYEDIGPTDELDPELRAYLTMNTYVKWGDPLFWDKLRYALPHTFKRHEKIPLQEIRRPQLYLTDDSDPTNES